MEQKLEDAIELANNCLSTLNNEEEEENTPKRIPPRIKLYPKKSFVGAAARIDELERQVEELIKWQNEAVLLLDALSDLCLSDTKQRFEQLKTKMSNESQ